jgi:NAD(P)-dependent dehydrogenase (short-subunit alcohol dehydrogenase family)
MPQRSACAGRQEDAMLEGAGRGSLGAVWRTLTRRPAPLDFAGRSVLITGASRGLGLEIARQLGREGARLTLVARGGERLEQAATSLRSTTAEVLAQPAEVGDPAQMEGAVAAAVARFGGLDVLINNAGMVGLGRATEIPLERYETAMAVHFWGPLHAMRAALPHLRRSANGRVVNVTAIEGRVGLPRLAPHAASKGALAAFSLCLRAEWVRENVWVTTVCPGAIRSGPSSWPVLRTPGISIDVARAARQVIRACRRGDAELVLPASARLLVRFHALAPGPASQLAAVADHFFPG